MAKNEFIREDPGSYRKPLVLVILQLILPVAIGLTGLFVTANTFAQFMNYDPEVVGLPLFSIRRFNIHVYNPIITALGLIKYSGNPLYAEYFFEACPAAIAGLILGTVLWLFTAIFTNSKQKNQHIHGTARWAFIKDLMKNGLLQKYGVVCGETEKARVTHTIDPIKVSMTLHLKKPAELICHSGKTNTLMCAPTRAGKGVNSIIPTCILYGVPHLEKKWNKKTKKMETVVEGRGSMVIFDPKGENWTITAGWRSTFSTCIPFRPLDPAGNTAHYNPIAEIPDSPSEAYAWADTIASIFFGAENAKAASDGATQYFNNTARDIFSAVVLHVRFSPDIPPKEKNMGKVLDIFSQASEEDESNDDEENGGCGSAMLKEMIETDHEDDLINQIIIKAANRSKIQTSKERASTYSTVFSKISLFQDPLIREATRYSDFSVDDFVNSVNGISLYLIVPYNHIARIAPVFRMVITFMIKKFSSGTTNAQEVKLKNHCLFLLDEFPVLGYFPDIAQNAGILAGYGVTFYIVCQALSQIIDIYGENHPFLDHCKTYIIYAPGNLKDAKMYSEIIGNRSVLLDNISSSGNKYHVSFDNVSRSSSETSVTLISPDELMKLDYSDIIVFNQGMPPYKGKKVVYYEDERFRHKAFREVPDMTFLRNQMKKLPSNNTVHLDSTPRKKIEGIKLIKYIPKDFSIFETGLDEFDEELLV